MMSLQAEPSPRLGFIAAAMCISYLAGYACLVDYPQNIAELKRILRLHLNTVTTPKPVFV